MAIKSTTKSVTSKKVYDFPCLKRNNFGSVVMFLAEDKGIVLKGNNGGGGHWEAGDWVDKASFPLLSTFDGEITLSNI